MCEADQIIDGKLVCAFEKPTLRQTHKVHCKDCEMLICGLEAEVAWLNEKLKEREAMLDKYADHECKDFLSKQRAT